MDVLDDRGVWEVVFGLVYICGCRDLEIYGWFLIFCRLK